MKSEPVLGSEPLENRITGDEAHDYKEREYHVEEVAVARLTEEDLFTLSQESLTMWSKTGWRICLIMFVQGCNQAGYGVDWGAISGINSFDTWHTYFGFPNAGTTYATVNALMNVGIIVGAPFLGLADIIGRRGINFVGNVLVLVAAFMQAFSPNVACFMVARFILGFGCGMMSSSQYIAEIAPVHLRGRIVGIFGACFQVGSLATLGAMVGFAKITSNWSWRIPLLIEGIFPAIVVFTIFFLTPESPRYLMMRGKKEEAKKIIMKYHTNSDDINHPLVQAVTAQIEDSLIHETANHFKAYWDFRVFVTKPVRYRLFVLILYSVFQQWNGGGIISYYLSPALDTIGITKTIPQLGVNIGLTAIYFVFTTCGAFIIDHFRRRTLIFSGLISFVILQTAATITSWRYAESPSSGAAALTLVWIFLYQICSSLLIATMHNLYPIEILSLTLRARGVGLYGVIQGIAGVVQSYGIGKGIQEVGYKIWVVYIVYNSIQLVAAYFFFPETFKLNLEEIDDVFETPGVHPVKMGEKIQKAKKEKATLEHGIGAGVVNN